jgi:8-oxo-dGTP diphosphatase
MIPPKRSVAGIACEGGKLFIAKRKPGGDLGGKWEFPGGKAEDSESDEEALLREYREECGVDVRVGDFLAASSFVHHGREFSLRAYRVSFAVADLRLAEHSEWRWASPAEIRGLDFAASDLALLPLLGDD